MQVNEKCRRHIVFKTPVGDMGLIYRDNPFILCRILLPGSRVRELSRSFLPDSFDPTRLPEKVNQAVTLILDCMQGKKVEIPWAGMAWEGVTELQKAVYYQTAEIPFGSLATYKEIARRIRRPNACRFVGTALAKNPFPVLIPCHRVIRSDNKIGGFGGGTRLKEQLINAESLDSLLRT